MNQDTEDNKIINKSSNFTIFPNRLFEDLKDGYIGHGEIVLYMYIRSKPNGWCFMVKNIMGDLGITSNHTFYKYRKNLVDSGWLKVEVTDNFTTYETFEEPLKVVVQKMHGGSAKNALGGSAKNALHNNTIYTNTISSNTDIYLNKEKESNKEKEKIDYESLFLDWYSRYPNKKSKDKAYQSFVKIIKEGKSTIELLNSGLDSYLKEIEHKKTTKEYIKHPSTWLNQGCWEDEYETGSETSTIQESKPTFSPEVKEELEVTLTKLETYIRKFGYNINIQPCLDKKELFYSNLYSIYQDWESYLLINPNETEDKYAPFLSFMDAFLCFVDTQSGFSGTVLYPGDFSSEGVRYTKWLTKLRAGDISDDNCKFRGYQKLFLTRAEYNQRKNK